MPTKRCLVFGLLALTLSATTAQTCSPTTDCPPLAMECMPCNPRTQPDCTPENLELFPDGMCTEPRWLHSYRRIFGARIPDRCRAIVDYAWAVQSPRPDGKQYVKACRQGEYTCNSGRCARWSKLPRACYRGMIDDPTKPNHDCNLANEAFRLKIEELWELQLLEGHDQCTLAGDNGIRYYPLRCNTRVSNLGLSSVCPPSQAVKPETCHESTFVNQLLGPSDACSDTCAQSLSLESIPGCCANPEAPTCSHVIVRSPSEPVPKCTEQQVSDGCHVCEASDSSQPGSNDYPYCCRSNTGTTSCADVDGFDINGLDNACGAVGSEFGELCYVDSSGSGAGNIAVADDESTTSGAVLTFKMDLVDDSLSQDSGAVGDCCCAITCSCYGDPHCTSFFADYEYSQVSSGTFTMISVEGFEVHVETGVPLGVLAHVHIAHPDIPGIKVFSADECVDGSNLDEMLALSYPFEYKGRNAPNSGMPVNEYQALNPVFIEVFYKQYTVEIKCVRFNMGSGSTSGWHSRLDISISRATSDLDVSGFLPDTCCPTSDQVFSSMSSSEGASGYCMRHPNTPGSYISGALADSHHRRLESAKETEQPETRLHLRQMRELDESESADTETESLYDSLMNNFVSLEDLTTVELVKMYQRVTGSSRQQAVIDLIDLGADHLQLVIESALANCFEYASDPIFNYETRNKCAQGLTLEAKLPNEAEWTPIKFFPAGLVYCNNQIKLIDQHTIIDELGNTLTSHHELRLTHCTVSREDCPSFDFCQPSISVRDLGLTKTLYSSTIADSVISFAKKSFELCKCKADPVACIEDCIMNANCPTEPCAINA